jgi:superfamily I DNA/RNA helicase
VTAQSSHTDEQGAIYLSTMHRAKGLEFDFVVVIAPKELTAIQGGFNGSMQQHWFEVY